jgi:hypothetical protein
MTATVGKVIQSRNFAASVDGPRDGIDSTRIINLGEIIAPQQETMGNAIHIVVPPYDITTIVNAPGLGGRSFREIN